MKKIIRSTIILLAIFTVLLSSVVKAESGYKIEDLEDTNNYGDFVVGPGKTELQLEPGDSTVINLTVTNRMGVDKTFKFTTEDFKGSNNSEETVVLLGNDRGPYSLKDYITFDSDTVTLKHGQRVTVPLTIKVPYDAQPGGLYGAVLVQTVSKKADKDISSNTANALVTRVGTLFFVKVPGPTKTEGSISEFYIPGNRKFLTTGPVKFNIQFKNTGNVYLNPYGQIKIRNIVGSEVADIEVKPWFAMPDSTRFREVTWDRLFAFGRYTATAEINRGYDNKIDTLSYSFWVIPVLPVVIVLVVLLVIAFLIKIIFSKFEIKKKS